MRRIPVSSIINKYVVGHDQNQLMRIAGERDALIRAQHTRFVDSYPSASQDKSNGPVDALMAHRKKVIYRSKQRGWLEVDLLLGSWATDNVMNLSWDELQQFENILNQETIDIFKIITKQVPAPTNLEGPILNRLQDYALSSPIGTANPTMYAKIKEKMSN